jgi:hypothetical protein
LSRSRTAGDSIEEAAARLRLRLIVLRMLISAFVSKPAGALEEVFADCHHGLGVFERGRFEADTETLLFNAGVDFLSRV